MSAAEIADNRWELSATKAPIATAGGMAQILVISGFAVFFGWILTFSVIGIVTPKAEDAGWAGSYKNLNASSKASDEAKPE